MDACCRSLSGSRAWAGRFLGALSGGMAIPGFPAVFLSAPAFAGSAACIRDVQGRLATASHDNDVVITHSYGAAGKRTSIAAAEILK